jgi:hypothetical protein
MVSHIRNIERLAAGRLRQSPIAGSEITPVRLGAMAAPHILNLLQSPSQKANTRRSARQHALKIRTERVVLDRKSWRTSVRSG